MNMRTIYLSAILLVLWTPVRADGPLPPPARVTACSTSGVVCVDSDPKTNRTVLWRKRGSKVLWSIAGWHRWLFASNDGAVLVVAYDGLNLIPADSTLQLEVLRFYNHGKLVRTIRLADLYDNRSQLTGTMSHLAWVNAITTNRENQLLVELTSGRKVVFGMATGQLQREVRHEG
jgi:hypothetical protein